MAQSAKTIRIKSVAIGGAIFLSWLWLAGICFTLGSAYWAFSGVPELPDLSDERRPASVSFYDRHDRLIGVRGSHSSRPANLDLLPDHLPEAIVAIEDRRFYAHPGVDPKALARAFVENRKAGRVVQGGSTITQQLAKVVFLSPDQNYKRKAQEAFIAMWLEAKYTKREIIELYLGRVYFGAGAYGIDAASELYFAKPSADLSLQESALLSGLLKAPADYAPVKNPAPAALRGKLVLDAMLRDEVITSEQYSSALNDVTWVEPTRRTGSEHYFLDYAWAVMEENLGVPEQDLIVRTTLDLDLQMAAGVAIATHINPDLNAGQAAVVSLDGTGGILVLVGGADYGVSQFNRATQTQRQPGSSFKPFVYLAAIEAGILPDDIRIDEPIKIGDWSPRNFNPGHLGEISMEDAFAKSLNTVAVGLSEEIGRERVVATAARFGHKDLQPLRSLPLGAHAASPLQMAESYFPFATYGRLYPAYGVKNIETASGEWLWGYERPEGKKVIEAEPLRQVNRLMMATVQRGTGTGARIEGWELAGKTGTTNDYRDAWFIGYAPDIVTAVWVGDDDYRPMKRVTGAGIPTRIWKDTMVKALDGRRPTALPRAVPSVVIEPKTEAEAVGLNQ